MYVFFYLIYTVQAKISRAIKESASSNIAENLLRAQYLDHLRMCVAREGLYVLKAVAYDGDCLYSSVRVLLPGLAPSNTALRNKLVRHLKSGVSILITFVLIKCDLGLK